MTVLLVSLYFPVRVVSIISIYETQHWLGLINNTSGLILPYVTLQLVISILVMRSMFQLVPHEVIKSAGIDGAGHWRALWEVGLPMVRNGLVVIFIVNFVAAWGEYLLVRDPRRRRSKAHDACRPRRRPGGPGTWAWPNLTAVYVIVVAPGESSPSRLAKTVLQRPPGRRIERVTVWRPAVPGAGRRSAR